MICSGLIAIVLGIQPVCSEAVYKSSLEPSLHGDSTMVGRAIFNAYLEQVSHLDVEQSESLGRIEEVKARRDREVKADALFDSFLESIALLNEDRQLKIGIMNARRSVLLDARQSNNPWPEAKWFDIAAIVQTNQEFVTAVNSFLIKHADDDRADRFAATIAKLEGNREKCAGAERRTMLRWAIYNELVEPFENDSTLEYRYTIIPKSGPVAELFFKITDAFQNTKTTDIVRGQMSLYTAMYKKQKLAIIELIKNARIKEGVDPLASGCGVVGETKNLILQRSAEIHELNKTTAKLMLSALTEEQRRELGYSE